MSRGWVGVQRVVGDPGSGRGPGGGRGPGVGG